MSLVSCTVTDETGGARGKTDPTTITEVIMVTHCLFIFILPFSRCSIPRLPQEGRL